MNEHAITRLKLIVEFHSKQRATACSSSSPRFNVVIYLLYIAFALAFKAELPTTTTTNIIVYCTGKHSSLKNRLPVLESLSLCAVSFALGLLFAFCMLSIYIISDKRSIILYTLCQHFSRYSFFFHSSIRPLFTHTLYTRIPYIFFLFTIHIVHAISTYIFIIIYVYMKHRSSHTHPDVCMLK